MSTELMDIIELALSELAHNVCPYCQSYISSDRYIDRSDIKKWVEEKGLHLKIVSH